MHPFSTRYGFLIFSGVTGMVHYERMDWQGPKYASRYREVFRGSKTEIRCRGVHSPKSKMGFVCKNSEQFLAVKYFRQKASS